nr:hypothetical protein [Acidobacteriota bacterium]
MVKDLQASKERGSEFVANPARVARQYGVTLSREEEFAVKFVSGLSIASIFTRVRLPVAFFDNNCGCPGPGPASW